MSDDPLEIMAVSRTTLHGLMRDRAYLRHTLSQVTEYLVQCIEDNGARADNRSEYEAIIARARKLLKEIR